MVGPASGATETSTVIAGHGVQLKSDAETTSIIESHNPPTVLHSSYYFLINVTSSAIFIVNFFSIKLSNRAAEGLPSTANRLRLEMLTVSAILHLAVNLLSDFSGDHPAI